MKKKHEKKKEGSKNEKCIIFFQENKLVPVFFYSFTLRTKNWMCPLHRRYKYHTAITCLVLSRIAM